MRRENEVSYLHCTQYTSRVHKNGRLEHVTS